MSRVTVALAVLFVAVLGGCAANESASTVQLSPAATVGQKLASGNGCASCHGSGGEGLVGPPFVGLFGSEVTLEDGSTLIADKAYLSESITDPSAKKVNGYRLPMPTNGLSADEVDSIVAYIVELADDQEASP